jgi:Ca2+-binding EF-hand superfamily protein
MGCQPRGHEVVGEEEFTLQQFLDTTNQIVERARRKEGDFYEKIFRMIDFHGNQEVDLDDLKVYCRLCGVEVREEVLSSLIHHVDSTNNDTVITKHDFLQWFEAQMFAQQERESR